MPDATKVFISYSHDSQVHMDRVLALSNRLRREGVGCRIDQYEQSPEEGWPKWCERQVERSTFVLVACTRTYLRRFKGEEEPRKGLGGTWEGHTSLRRSFTTPRAKTVSSYPSSSPKRTPHTSLLFFTALLIMSSAVPRATSCFTAASPTSLWL